MLSGWIKLHRQLLGHWIFSFKNPDKALAWVFLVTSANHCCGEVLIKGRIKKVDRGQLAMSQLTLQDKFNWSQNKLKRFLKLLKNERMIDYKTDDLTTIITICNYDSFQGSDKEDERPHERTDERPVERYADDQSNDKQECKKKNNGKKEQIDFAVLQMSEVQVRDVIRIRKKNQGTSLTQRIVNSLAKEFKQAMLLGYSFDDLLTEWEVRGWKSFKAEWIKPNQNSQQGTYQIKQFPKQQK